MISLIQNTMKMKTMKISKEINYFDTPDDRRKGKTAMANLMATVLKDREKARDALNNFIPNETKNEPTNNDPRI